MNFDDVLKNLNADNIDDLNKILKGRIESYNNSGINDFEGLSPSSMNYVLFDPYNEKSPMKVNIIDNETAKKIKIVCDCFIMLEVMVEFERVEKDDNPFGINIEYIYRCFDFKIREDRKFMKEKNEELVVEEDFMYVHCLLGYLIALGYIAESEYSFSIGEKGKNVLKREDFSGLYYDLLCLCIMSSVKREEEIEAKGIVYTIYLLNKYGKEPRSSNFYYGKYEITFFELKSLKKKDKESSSERYYLYNFFDSLRLMGLCELEGEHGKKDKERMIKKSEVFDKVISFK
jgi:hypothetical protein